MNIEQACKDIEENERREAAALMRADVSVLDSLWDENLVVYSGPDTCVEKITMLNLVQAGGLRPHDYRRRTLAILLEEDFAVAIGSDLSRFHPSFPTGAVLSRSYVNVWARRADVWKLLARYPAPRVWTSLLRQPTR